MPNTNNNTKDFRAVIRDDLIRRLFAVAISVGAAATLSQMNWVQKGLWPCLAEWQQLLILIAAMTATVLSWDGYLFSIHDRPLISFWRFAIDIMLVFIYMLLLMTSKLLVWWLFLHAFIYVLYAIWDLLTIRDWKSKYYPGKIIKPAQQTVIGVYTGGLTNKHGVSRGPIITLTWGIYFWALYFWNIRGLVDRIFVITIFVVLGLWLYRKDKTDRFTMLSRAGVITLLFLACIALTCYGPRDATIWNLVSPYIGSASCG